jgi:cell wall-associated NlpC family hydrolase
MTPPSAARFAAEAVALAGAPFRLHGRDPATGLDCVGLVCTALARSGAHPVAPSGYRLHALSIAPLLSFAEANGFVSALSEATAAAGDLLLVYPGPLQAHLVIASGGETFVHAHAGLGRVVCETRPVPWLIAARWRLATKG